MLGVVPASSRPRRSNAARSNAARSNAAQRAEPKAIGSARARDPLALEVKLLGSLLGQVIVEQEGVETFELVERVRRATIRRRRTAHADGIPELDTLAPRQLAALARAFALYFLLTNLAEEKHRVRVLRRRRRAARGRALDESVEAAIRALTERGLRRHQIEELVERLRIGPVLTAHPTEARRRTVLTAQRRIYGQLDRLDDPRLTPDEDADARRRLREEVTMLWQTALVRDALPSPLDEVRAMTVFFDETLFDLVPRLYRSVETALRRTTAQPATRAFLQWGSWVGGDRDGHPAVTASVTRATLRIQADHILRGYERVADRLLQSLAITAAETPAAEAYLTDVARESEALPELAASLRERFPRQPYRQALGFLRERIARTRARLTDVDAPTEHAYESPNAVLADLRSMQAALAAQGADRVAWGELQDLAWQVDTFGFHLAELEVRQHSEVHRAAVDCLRAQGDAEATLPIGGITANEVIDTFRAMWDLQATFGEEACCRYVISFTAGVDDVLDVLDLASQSRGARGEAIPMDVVPLLESGEALENAGPFLDELLGDSRYRSHLRARGNRQEVMLGYSDSNKELGFLAAAWALYRAQRALTDAARRAGIELTLFHGRGGPIGRGGGPANRAIRAQAPGSVDARLKLTEQGEVIAARYANPEIAGRELEQLTHAVLLATVGEGQIDSTADGQWAAMMDELAEHAVAAYRALVWDEPAFERFFQTATPIAELAGLRIGSRPVARAKGSQALPTLTDVRAIPWVFAWTQSRANLPGWYGLGSALRGYRKRHGSRARAELTRAYREWPFLASTLDNAELALATADPEVAARYAALAGAAADMERIAAAIDEEFWLSVDELTAVTGRQRLLDDAPRLQRSIELRNPYVDALSELQVRLLARSRELPADSPDRAELEGIIHLTVSGIAAGLQHTG